MSQLKFLKYATSFVQIRNCKRVDKILVIIENTELNIYNHSSS